MEKTGMSCAPIQKLLTTKLYIPPVRPERIPRPRLTLRLNESLRRTPGVTLISAPPGYGKTTLLSSWIYDSQSHSQSEEFVNRQSKIVNPPVAWLSLDEGDNDPTRFLAYVIAALQQINPNLGQTLQETLKGGGPFPPLETLITSLLNDMTACSTPLLLVLDDYHAIEARPIHEGMAFLLNHLPPPLHLVIASRTVPPLPLSRLRVRAQLTEIRAADLRFTSAEISEFLNTSMGLDLSANDVTALESRTEGWIAGLQLAALSLQEQPNRSDFIKTFTGDDRYVLDYLLDEVFSRQPEIVQHFLLQTSILDRLCASLCDAVTGFTPGDLRLRIDDKPEIANGPAMLTYLEKTNLFIVPLDNKREWYRYHSLLVDLLRHRLQQTPLPFADGVAELHRRAAHWYEPRGFMSETIRHLLAAQDFLAAAQLVEQIGAEMLWRRGEITTLRNWLEKLPPSLLHIRPKLCLYLAETLYLTGQFEAIEPFLDSAEAHLQAAQAGYVVNFTTRDEPISSSSLPGITSSPEKDETGNLLGEVMAVRALLTGLRGNLSQTAEAIALARQALALLSKDELRLRGPLTIGLAETYYMNGSVVEAGQIYVQAIELGQASHKPFLVMAGMVRLAEVQMIQGQLHRAAETCRQMQQLAIDSVHLPSNLTLSELPREWNDLAAAQQQVQQSLDYGDMEGNLRILVQAYVTLARILQAQGDMTGALEAIQSAVRLEQDYQVSQLWDLPPVAAHLAWLRLKQGDIAAAARWAEEQKLQPDDVLTFACEVDYLVLARLLIAQNRADEAAALLERLGQAAETGGRISRVIEALALHALALQAQDDISAALTSLSRALSLAEPEGYIRLFVDEGQPMAELLQLISRQLSEGSNQWSVVSQAYMAKLLAAFSDSPLELTEQGQIINRNVKVTNLIEPLTERELEILKLIAEGLSNAEIAHQLFLTVGTVKLHAHNVYGKLGVNTRTQAVAKAQALNLLPPA